jgi:hypothetical protein
MEGGCQLPLGVFCEGEKVHVSYAKTASEKSAYFLFDSNEVGVVEKIVSQLKSI